MKNATFYVIGAVAIILVSAQYLHDQTQKMSIAATPNAQMASDLPVNLRGLLTQSGTVTIPDVTPATTIKLTGDTTEYGDVNTDPMKPFGTVTIVDPVMGNTQQIFTILAINTGGSGEEFYLTAFEASDSAYVMKDAEMLGDRIQIDSVTLTENKINVLYRQHTATQAMVDKPTEAVNETFVYADGKLVKE